MVAPPHALLLLAASSSAWSPVAPRRRCRPRSAPAAGPFPLSSSSRSSEPQIHCALQGEGGGISPPLPLSSAYDPSLPPSLVGEAVRSALRSDRGICLDFSADRYAAAAGGGGDGGPPRSGSTASGARLVSVVGVRGEGATPFVNAKFSRSVPSDGSVVSGGRRRLSKTTELMRMGHAFETAYLTPKGRIVDRLLVLAFSPGNGEADEGVDDALLIASPGNSGPNLHDDLDRFVFPMDRVALSRCEDADTTVITLACSSLRDARTSFDRNVLNLLLDGDSISGDFSYPDEGVCHHYRVSGSSPESHADVYLVQHTFLPPEICRGYTLVFRESPSSIGASLSGRIWDNLVDERNDRGPVGVGSREYETLRIEAGSPGYGSEMTGDGPKKGKGSYNNGDQFYAKSNPLELHLQRIVDTEKGCYQGQEGVASMLKNPKGPPRQLYQAVFYDSENDFGGGADGLGMVSIDTDELRAFHQIKKPTSLPNETRQPLPGDSIFVLGSNESIQVGTITSVAEPNGTGEAKTLGLALVKRPGSILNAIRDQDLELPRWWEDPEEDEGGGGGRGGPAMGPSDEKGGSGIIHPPPLDPLHNLEIVVGGTYTVGRLISVPSRRPRGGEDIAPLLDYERRGEVVDAKDKAPAYFQYEFPDGDGKNTNAEVVANTQAMALDSLPLTKVDEESDVTDQDDRITDDLLAKAEEEAAKAAAEAEAAAAEAKRKADKMELLKARAEAAMAARRKKRQSN